MSLLDRLSQDELFHICLFSNTLLEQLSDEYIIDALSYSNLEPSTDIPRQMLWLYSCRLINWSEVLSHYRNITMISSDDLDLIRYIHSHYISIDIQPIPSDTIELGRFMMKYSVKLVILQSDDVEEYDSLVVFPSEYRGPISDMVLVMDGSHKVYGCNTELSKLLSTPRSDLHVELNRHINVIESTHVFPPYSPDHMTIDEFLSMSRRESLSIELGSIQSLLQSRLTLRSRLINEGFSNIALKIYCLFRGYIESIEYSMDIYSDSVSFNLKEFHDLSEEEVDRIADYLRDDSTYVSVCYDPPTVLTENFKIEHYNLMHSLITIDLLSTSRL